MEFRLEEYSFEEFIEIARNILKLRFNFNDIVSEKIVDSVWTKMKSKDIRDVINVAKLAGSCRDIDWLMEVQMKYGKYENHGK